MHDELLPQKEDAVIFDLSSYYGAHSRNLKQDIELAQDRFSVGSLNYMKELFKIPASQRTAKQHDTLYNLLVDFRKHISGVFTENAASIVTGHHFHSTCNTFRNESDVANLEIRSDADPDGIDWGRLCHYKGRSCDKELRGYDKNNTKILGTGTHVLTKDLTQIVGKKEKLILTSSYEEAMDWAYSAKIIIYLYGTCRVGTVRRLREQALLLKENNDELHAWREGKCDYYRAKLNGEAVGEFTGNRKVYAIPDLGSGNPPHLLLNSDNIIYFPRSEYLVPLDKTADIATRDKIAQKFIVPYEKLEEVIANHRK